MFAKRYIGITFEPLNIELIYTNVMAVKFNIHEMGNAIDPTAPTKFYARPIHTGEKTLEDIAEDISHASSLTESDVYAVLQSLVREIPRNIAQGNIVRLGNLGSFRLGAHSTGSDRKEEVSEHNIHTKRIIFHAGKLVKKELNKIVFEKNDR